MGPPPGEVHSLRTLSAWPVDADEPFFAAYPAMKLGLMAAAEHYAELLVPVVVGIIDAAPQVEDWVAMAPQRVVLPAGANLLCEAVVARVQPQLAAPRSLRLLDVVEPVERTAITNAEELRRYNDYSRMAVEERRSIYEARSLRIDRAEVEGQGLIYINDINVSGTQLAFLRARLPGLGPAALHFVYIVDCAPELGRAFPQLEASINGFDTMAPGSRAALLARSDLRPTAKCLSTLMGLPFEDLRQTCSQLPPDAALALRRAFELERRFEAPVFAPRLALLEARAARGR